MIIELWADGSARNNGSGPGGWAAILKYGDHIKEIFGGFRLTTNNRMELFSVIEAIKCIKNKNCTLNIYSDSAYVVNSIEKGWVDNWEKTNYKDKKNSDLWKEFQKIRKDFIINIIWVKGHESNINNIRCDLLATTQSSDENKLYWKIDTFYEN